MRSALLTACWTGAETIYVENLDFPQWTPRHPLADPDGSLVAWSSADQYKLTSHRRVVRDIYKTYVSRHPRTIHWRDDDPRVAIMRLPDGRRGRFPAGQDRGEPASRNRLLVNRDMPLDEPASEWLHVWSILTHGTAAPGGETTAR